MSLKNPRRALIVTGEASGDLHGANLILAAREIDPELAFFGVGGTRMADAGCEIVIPGETLSVMGFVEVIGHFPVIYRAFQQLKRLLRGAKRPDLLILIDFPDFNLRLAAEAKKAGVPVLYYVSPQVWAWRRGRVKKIARVVDRLAVIFPFEAEYYRGEDIIVEYVGNPLLDEAKVERDRDEFLVSLGLDPRRPVVGLFPGSRQNELKYILETILASAALLQKEKSDIQFLLPVAPSLSMEVFRQRLAGSALPILLVQENIYEVAHACDAVIAVSGTVTLQVAFTGTPMAVLYRMAPVTYAIGRRLIRVPHISLANIVAGERVVREFIQEEATPEAVSAEICRILEDSDYRHRIQEGLARVKDKMGQPGCSLRVAEMASAMSREKNRSGNHGQ